MKRLLILSLTVAFFAGCSSSSKPAAQTPVQQQVNSSKQSNARSRVEIKNADGSTTPVKLPGSKQTLIYDPKTGKKVLSDGWVDARKDSGTAGRYLQKLSADELIKKLRTASALEASLIIEEAKSRKSKGVKVLAHILSDSRKTVFMKGREYWWYEKKGVEAEAIELRVYAAFTLQYVTRQYPESMVMNMSQDRLIFAVKGKYAVVKDDVVKVWSKWWEQAKNDY